MGVEWLKVECFERFEAENLVLCQVKDIEQFKVKDNFYFFDSKSLKLFVARN